MSIVIMLVYIISDFEKKVYVDYINMYLEKDVFF